MALRFPVFRPEENLNTYHFTQYFDPTKAKKIMESHYDMKYDQEWIEQNDLSRGVDSAQTHIKKLYESSKDGKLQTSLREKRKGRYFYHNSLSIGLLSCPFRHSLCREDYVDYDMVNAHFKILEQLCILNNISKDRFKYISQYVNQRDVIRQRLSKLYFPDESFDSTKKKIKVLFIRLMYLGKFESWRADMNVPKTIKQDETTYHIRNEMLGILYIVKDNNEDEWNRVKEDVERQNKQIKKKNEKNGTIIHQRNPDASFLSKFLQSWERKIIEVLTHFLIHELDEPKVIKDNVFVYTFDGFMVKKQDDIDPDEICREFTTIIKEKLDITIRWETKEFDEHLDDIFFKKNEDFTFQKNKLERFDKPFLNDLVSYAEKKAYFEQFCCKTTIPETLFWIKTNKDNCTNYHFYNLTQLKQALVEVKVHGDKDGKFIDRWVEDIEKTEFECHDFIPYPTDPQLYKPKYERVFNTFTGYNPVCFDETIDYGDTKEQLSSYLYVLKNLLGGDDDDLNSFLCVIASKIQNPNRKLPFSILLKSTQGEGKNSVMNILGAIVNPCHYFYSANSNDIFGDHAEGIQNKLFIVLNEMGIGDTKPHMNKFKQLITEDLWRINPKNIRPFDIKNIAQIIVLSNEQNPIYLDPREQDRRWFIYEGNGINASIETEKWDMAHERWKSPQFIKCLYDYLMSYPTKKKENNLRSLRRENSRKPAYKKVVSKYSFPDVNFITEHILQKRLLNGANTTTKKYKSTGKGMCDELSSWCGNDGEDIPSIYVEDIKKKGWTQNPWYEDPSYLYTTFNIKGLDLLQDFKKYLELHNFPQDRNARSSKAFYNSLKSHEIGMNFSRLKNNTEYALIRPVDIIDGLIGKNYEEFDDEIMMKYNQTKKTHISQINPSLSFDKKKTKPDNIIW